MNNPLVSILMPVKNTGKFTKKAIESILEQMYDNFELLILDSSDDNITTVIIKSFSDSRIKYFYRPELNLPQILNYGIEIAGGEFIARMDGDDISMSDRISIEMNYLLSHPETDITGTQFYYIDGNDKILYRKNLPVEHKDIEFMMPVITSIHHPTILTKKVNFIKAGMYNESRIYSEDTELYLRMLNAGAIFHNIDTPLLMYRITERSYDLFEKQNKIKYNDCVNYINNYYNEECFDSNIRRGLLEYYIGDISLARKFLYRSMMFGFLKALKYWRYLTVSLLGNNIIRFIRRHRISEFYNKIFIKLFHHDTYNIKS